MYLIHNFPILCCFIFLLGRQAHICRSEPMYENQISAPDGKELSFVAFIQLRNEEYPKGRQLCTGSLISRTHVLTAEQCLKNLKDTNRLEILVGSSELKDCKKYYPTTWISYKKWAWLKNKSLKLKYREYDAVVDDIAIIKLNKPVSQSNVKAAKLTGKSNEKLYERDAQIAAWTNHPFQNDLVLVKYNAHIMSWRSCEEYASILRRSNVYVHETELCATTDSSITLSMDDLGAPLFYKDRTILGVLKGACLDEDCTAAISIYSGIHHYNKFIESVLKE